MPTHLYDRSTRHVDDFKWAVHQKLVDDHGAVLAKFGDKLWDVAHRSSLRSYLGHVSDADCYLFWDPRLNGTVVRYCVITYRTAQYVQGDTSCPRVCPRCGCPLCS